MYGCESWTIKEAECLRIDAFEFLWKRPQVEKTLMLGKIEGRSSRGQQRMRWLDGITDLVDMSFEQNT